MIKKQAKCKICNNEVYQSKYTLTSYRCTSCNHLYDISELSSEKIFKWEFQETLYHELFKEQDNKIYNWWWKE